MRAKCRRNILHFHLIGPRCLGYECLGFLEKVFASDASFLCSPVPWQRKPSPMTRTCPNQLLVSITRTQLYQSDSDSASGFLSVPLPPESFLLVLPS